MGMNKKQTFILEISDTQNQSWQGKVEWIQGKKKESFRSVLELLRMLDSVVCQSVDKDSTPGNITEGTYSGMRQQKSLGEDPAGSG